MFEVCCQISVREIPHFTTTKKKINQNLEIFENFEISPQKWNFQKPTCTLTDFCLELASGDPTYLLPQLIPGGAASDSVAPPPTKRIPLCRFPRNRAEVCAKIQCMRCNFCRERQQSVTSAAKSRVPMTTNPRIRSGTMFVAKIRRLSPSHFGPQSPPPLPHCYMETPC